ncbi:hypothetical protein GALL_474620 [mine drainage metagenome]|uniref:Uncharacterized protein n=1 Tax=mine drainage metagenome TaxID=410659 RepID=A0A1J5Q0A6_9ZZZZ
MKPPPHAWGGLGWGGWSRDTRPDIVGGVADDSSPGAADRPGGTAHGRLAGLLARPHRRLPVRRLQQPRPAGRLWAHRRLVEGGGLPHLGFRRAHRPAAGAGDLSAGRAQLAGVRRGVQAHQCGAAPAQRRAARGPVRGARAGAGPGAQAGGLGRGAGGGAVAARSVLGVHHALRGAAHGHAGRHVHLRRAVGLCAWPRPAGAGAQAIRLRLDERFPDAGHAAGHAVEGKRRAAAAAGLGAGGAGVRPRGQGAGAGRAPVAVVAAGVHRAAGAPGAGLSGDFPAGAVDRGGGGARLHAAATPADRKPHRVDLPGRHLACAHA